MINTKCAEGPAGLIDARDYRLYNISRCVDCVIDGEARPGIYLGCRGRRRVR
jgi:hypothetical protein